MKEAMFYSKNDGKIRCKLCIFQCTIEEGRRGFCRVRENRKGKLYNLIYGKLTSFSVDPIEKTPCFHFYPNNRFLMIGSAGCNLRCEFCLTWNITQVPLEEISTVFLMPKKLVRAALELDCKGIVYTHSEPTLNLEYYSEIMKDADEKKLLNVFATNGLISKDAFKHISNYTDAVIISLKGDDSFYRNVCGSSRKKVLNEIRDLALFIKEEKIHLEIVYVLIPNYQKNLGEVINFAGLLNSPLIFLRYIPSYRMDNISSTPLDVMESALNLAYESGLEYVYLENIYSHPGKNTYCPKCKNLIIKREGYDITVWKLKGRKCYCGNEIPLVF